jgi:uncharacterized OB-fold protein
MAQPARYPRPHPTPLDRPYWDGLREERLVLQRCAECARFQWFPRPRCTQCASLRLSWEPVEPRGELFTYTITHQRVGFAFDELSPFAVGIVELPVPGVVRMAGLLRDVPPDAVQVGLSLRGTFRHDPAGGESVMEFVPVEASL